MTSFSFKHPLDSLGTALGHKPIGPAGPPPSPPATPPGGGNPPSAPERTERELQASEQRLLLALKAGGLGAFEYAMGDNHIVVSPEFCQIFRLPPKTTLPYEVWAEAMHPEDHRLVLAEIQRMLTELTPVDLEHRLAVPKDQIRWIRVMASPVTAKGAVARIFGVVQEITKRKQAELELRQFSRAVEQCPVSVVITDLGGNIEYVNPKFCAVTEYTAEEVRGKNPRFLKSGEMSPEAYQEMWATIAAGGEWHGEFHNRKKCGELYWETASLSPVWNAEGRITHYIALKEDITDHKRLEEFLRLSEARFRGYFELGVAGMAITSPAKDCLEVNEQMSLMLGYTAQEFRSLSWTDFTHPEDLPDEVEQFNRILTGECDGYSVDKRVIRKDGRMLDTTTSVKCVRRADGTVDYLMMLLLDVTEHKQAARQLVELREHEERVRRDLEREQALNEIKGRFVSLVSHEFRTPLCIIKMAASLLETNGPGGSGAEAAGPVREIQRAVEHMTGMMDDLLLHEKIQRGTIECQPAPVNVEAFCRALIPELLHPLHPHRVVECTVEAAVGEVLLDQTVLRHILGNLLGNALKYSGEDQPVTLTVTRMTTPAPTPDAPPEEHLEFKVCDTGIGIPEADLGHLFQNFHRAGNVGNRPGTGMGLAIVKQFVDLHRGGIRLESREGRGTTVWVWLPCGAPPEAESPRRG